MRILGAALALLLSACAARTGSPGLPESGNADIVILGETHDNAEHHRTQAALIRELAPTAVVFEMLDPQQADIANRISSRRAELRDALQWTDSGWPAWALYEPVFEATDETPIYGMALPGDRVRRAVSEGAAAVFGADAVTYGLVEPLPAMEQATREAQQLAAHCDMLPPEMLPGMVEAQRLRDAAFARTALQALAERGAPVVVIAGTGHARRDWGIPAAITRARPDVVVTSLGQLEGDQDTSPPFDTWLVTEPTPREDPCAGFAASRAEQQP